MEETLVSDELLEEIWSSETVKVDLRMPAELLLDGRTSDELMIETWLSKDDKPIADDEENDDNDSRVGVGEGVDEGEWIEPGVGVGVSLRMYW